MPRGALRSRGQDLDSAQGAVWLAGAGRGRGSQLPEAGAGCPVGLWTVGVRVTALRRGTEQKPLGAWAGAHVKAGVGAAGSRHQDVLSARHWSAWLRGRWVRTGRPQQPGLALPVSHHSCEGVAEPPVSGGNWLAPTATARARRPGPRGLQHACFTETSLDWAPDPPTTLEGAWSWEGRRQRAGPE